MTDNVFGDQPTPVDDTTPAATRAPEDLLKNIKNENGEQKYKSLEDALIALDHSQKYIPELKNQLTGTQSKLQELEQKVGKYDNIEETVQRLLANQPTPAATPPGKSGLDEQEVRKLLNEGLQAQRQAEILTSNQQKVNEKLLSKYGEKATEVLDAKAAELGTTRQALGELAKQTPDIVLALFETPTSKDPTPSVPSRRTPDPKKFNDAPRKPEKSLLSGPGANRTDQGNRFAELRKAKYGEYGIDS